MNKYSLVLAVVVGMFTAQAAFAAEDCVKTLMGTQCTVQQSGTSAHMRGNAVENAKASKALKEAKAKAKKKAIAVGSATKKNGS